MTKVLALFFAASSLAALEGCGGSGNHEGGTTSSATPYAGFPYSGVLYRGTITGKNGAGKTVSVPFGLTVPPSGSGINGTSGIVGYGLTTGNPSAGTSDESYYLDDSTSASLGPIVDFPDNPIGEDQGTLSGGVSGKNLRLSFEGRKGLSVSVNAVVDVLNLTPAKPPAGTYSGTTYGRESVSGNLKYAGPALGTVASDGTFAFTYKAGRSGTSGNLSGRIAADGTITVTAFTNAASETGEPDPMVMAYGNAADLTVVIRSTSTQQIGDTYRMVRTGA